VLFYERGDLDNPDVAAALATAIKSLDPED